MVASLKTPKIGIAKHGDETHHHADTLCPHGVFIGSVIGQRLERRPHEDKDELQRKKNKYINYPLNIYI